MAEQSLGRVTPPSSQTGKVTPAQCSNQWGDDRLYLLAPNGGIVAQREPFRPEETWPAEIGQPRLAPIAP
jgi:hypothetical protein